MSISTMLLCSLNGTENSVLHVLVLTVCARLLLLQGVLRAGVTPYALYHMSSFIQPSFCAQCLQPLRAMRRKLIVAGKQIKTQGQTAAKATTHTSQVIG